MEKVLANKEREEQMMSEQEREAVLNKTQNIQSTQYSKTRNSQQMIDELFGIDNTYREGQSDQDPLPHQSQPPDQDHKPQLDSSVSPILNT
jgi:hypothetical protein